MWPLDVAVLGGGPAGVLCALAAARRSRVVLLARPYDTVCDPVPRTVEAVPAPLLTLLLEFGIHPGELGVDGVHTSREVAWEDATPSVLDGASTAHVERPCLESALWRRARQARRLEIVIAARPDVAWEGTCWRGDGWTARYLVDATGRRAVTAKHRVGLGRPWVARMWSFPPAPANVRGSVAIAALPGGYVYRLASRRMLLVGLVGPSFETVRDWGILQGILSASQATWIVQGLSPSLARRERSRIASVQWSTADPAPAARVLRVGDAALARDALSSQGLATSLSEAVYAAAALQAEQAPGLLARRQGEQRSVHIRSLRAFFDRCRWRNAPAWSAYRDWLCGYETAGDHVVALRDGALCEV